MRQCKITIQDEVVARLDGVDAADRRALVKMFEYEIPGARYLPSVRLGRWNGKKSYFELSGKTYINLLDRIIPYLQDKSYDIELDDQREYATVFEFQQINENTFARTTWPKNHPKEGEPIVLRDYQVSIVNQFLSNPQSMQEIATGAGKCQPYDSKILTENGWTTMGEIKIGDKVITPKGRSVSVLNIYEPGYKDIYEIEFDDGRIARCCEDHIWRVYNIGWRPDTKAGGPWRNISTKDLIELRSNTNRKIGIPLVSMKEDTRDVDLPIDPWLMGFLLGDGSFRNSRIDFTTADSELVKKVESLLDSDYTVRKISKYDFAIRFRNEEIQKKALSSHLKRLDRDENGHIIPTTYKKSSHKYVQQIIDLGLNNKYSHEKFVPEIYFSGSLKQRMDLIRGLVDSDGTVNRSSVAFTSTSKQLAEDFQRLVWSVGGIARIKEKNTNYYNYNGERRLGKKSYNVITRYPEPWNLMTLQKKIKKTKHYYQYGETLKLGIKNIKKSETGAEQVRCIYIDDSDHLYITDNYVVTHNTLITAALSYSCEQLGRTIVIVPTKNLVVQTEEDYRNLGLDVGVYFGDRKEHGHRHTISTWQSINNLIKDSQEGRYDITIEEFMRDIVCVIIDEAHSVRADVLHQMLTGVMSRVPIRWGLTGTIPKELFASQALFTSIGPLINKLSASDLQDRGVLAQCHVNIVQLQDHADFKTYQTELKHLLEDQTRLDTIGDLITRINETGNTLILVDRVAAGRELERRLPNSVFISGDTKLVERKEEYDQVAVSDDKIIIATYGIAAVGINIPRIFNLVLIEPGKSFVRVIQSIGRGIRKAEDKNFVQIWDITSSCRFSKRHLTQRKTFYNEANYPFTVERLEYR